jgi:hypothetical protein
VSAHATRVVDSVVGARIVHAEQRTDGLLVLVFEHRGTDDDAGYLIVPSTFVSFNDEGDPDGWKNDTA